MQMKIDLKDFTRFDRDLRRFGKNVIPRVNSNAINSYAFEARKEYIEGIEKNFEIRNNFIKNSVRVVKSNPQSQRAEVGSVAPGMDLQEFGGVNKSKKGTKNPIASHFSSGEEKSKRKRKRIVKRPNRLRNMKNFRSLDKRFPGKSKKQQLTFKVRHAVASTGKDRYLYAENVGPKKATGIFKVVGPFRKNELNESFWPKGARLVLVQDLSKRGHVIPATPTLGPAIDRTAKKMPQIYRKEALKQLARENIFRANRRR